jgi:hypothetical protein
MYVAITATNFLWLIYRYYYRIEDRFRTGGKYLGPKSEQPIVKNRGRLQEW